MSVIDFPFGQCGPNLFNFKGNNGNMVLDHKNNTLDTFGPFIKLIN